MQKCWLSILIILILYSNAYSQTEIGTKAAAGLSKISNPGYTNSKYQPSGQLGIWAQHKFKKHLFFETELLLLQLRGRQFYNAPDIQAILYSNISYLSLPAYLGIKFNKLSVSIGGQFSYAVICLGSARGQSLDGNGNNASFKSRLYRLEINRFDFGPSLQLTYDLTNKFSLDANAFYGANNFLPEQPYAYRYRACYTRFFAIGIHYTIFSKWQ